MAVRKLMSILALGAVCALSGGAQASPTRAPSAALCTLRDLRVTSVVPYNEREGVGRGYVERLRGADVRVLAEPGLTKEWLQLVIVSHLHKTQNAAPDCAINPKDVSVKVDSAGTGFSVKFIAKQSQQATDVLRRARGLKR